MKNPDEIYSEEQMKAFSELWYIYGNNGKKCTLFNHKLIQGFYHYGANRIEVYVEGRTNMIERWGEEKALKDAVTDECVEVAQLVLDNKISEALRIAKKIDD